MKIVLIVDDQQEYHDLAKSVLREKCADIMFLDAYNGGEGLSLLAKNQKEIGAVLLDLDMPFVNGWDFLKFFVQIYAGSSISKLPIIIYSGELLTKKFHDFKSENLFLSLSFFHKTDKNFRREICNVFSRY